ncbi:MAG TPA: hypothetical protein VHS99_26815 [Chloroflexota bacterium]|nr:hypothetical protein [Chloroflexota bacterium]
MPEIRRSRQIGHPPDLGFVERLVRHQGLGQGVQAGALAGQGPLRHAQRVTISRRWYVSGR